MFLFWWRKLVRKRTYIIGHYNPSVRIIDLVSHTTSVVCVNFIHEWRDLQFKVDSEQQIFEKLFMAILFSLRVFARNLLRGNQRRNTFRILFWCLAWGSKPGFLSNKSTHYLLNQQSGWKLEESYWGLNIFYKYCYTFALCYKKKKTTIMDHHKRHFVQRLWCKMVVICFKCFRRPNVDHNNNFSRSVCFI